MVLIDKFDRAYRHQQHLLDFEAWLKENGIALVFVLKALDTSKATKKLMLKILESFAKFERNTIYERTRNGRKAKLEKKKTAGGLNPLGYLPDWKIIPEEAQVVKTLFQQYIEKRSLSKLAKYARKHGLTSKAGKELSRQSIAVILKNRSYLGEYKYDGIKEHNDIFIKTHHKPIIIFRIFAKVQKLRIKKI